MKMTKLPSMTVDQLVAHFVEIGEQQDQALLLDEIANFNRLYKQKAAVVSELKSREGDQRRALLRLYDHPNMQVRINAAKATLAIAPTIGRQVLEAICASQHPPQDLEAGMTLFNLDEGIFKPT